jgi:UDP-glucose 4-epimerase
MDVYAPNDTVHIESDDPSPRNSYGLSKLLTEQITRFAVDNGDHLSAVCLRFANVYGPRETNAHLIPDALERMTSVVDSEIRMGYLGGARDFVHVFDIVDAIVTCLFQDTGSYEIFNVGSGVSTPVRKIVEIIRDAFGDDRPIVEDANKLRSFDRKSLTPDITRIQQRTSWRPRIVIEDGLKSLVEESLNVSVNF